MTDPDEDEDPPIEEKGKVIPERSVTERGASLSRRGTVEGVLEANMDGEGWVEVLFEGGVCGGGVGGSDSVMGLFSLTPGVGTPNF